MATQETFLIVGHGPVAEAVAMALQGAGWSVNHVAPQPDGLPFALPLVCPVKELSALPDWPNLPLEQPAMHSASPTGLKRAGGQWELELDNGSTLTASQLLICSSRWAARLLPHVGLSLPLRPVRAHQLSFKDVQLLPKPRAEHLGYGTVAAWTSETDTVLIYDGLADPAQATFSSQPDAKVVGALTQWLQGNIAVADTMLKPEVTGWSLGTTPDYLPILGPWPGMEGLWIISGYAAWGASLAMAIAGQVVTTFKGQPWPAALACVGPGRFRDGLAQPVLRPQWLIERNEVNIQPQFATTVRLVGGKTVNMRTDTEVQLVGSTVKKNLATTVRTTETNIQRPAVMGNANAQGKPEKGKVRMASVGFKT